jgi:predicted aspartyl protease
VSHSFNPAHGLVIVHAKVWGPKGDTALRLALDTGATHTLINQSRLMRLGYDPAASMDRLQITMGGSVEFVPRIAIDKLTALGQERNHIPVLAHNLPPSASVDGLLGLDFLRGQTLTLDFRTGQITLT